jgi:hypothetical protein
MTQTLIGVLLENIPILEHLENTLLIFLMRLKPYCPVGAGGEDGMQYKIVESFLWMVFAYRSTLGRISLCDLSGSVEFGGTPSMG